MPKHIATIGCLLPLMAVVGCTKDLEIDVKYFACQTNADCVDSVCDPLAKVCRFPGEDVSRFNLGDLGPGGDRGPDIPADVDPGEPVTCQDYCDGVMAACGESASNPVTGQYVNLTSCLSICETSMYDGGAIDIRGGRELRAIGVPQLPPYHDGRRNPV